MAKLSTWTRVQTFSPPFLPIHKSSVIMLGNPSQVTVFVNRSLTKHVPLFLLFTQMAVTLPNYLGSQSPMISIALTLWHHLKPNYQSNLVKKVTHRLRIWHVFLPI